MVVIRLPKINKTTIYFITTLAAKASIFVILPISAIFLDTKNFADFGIIFPTITLMTIASSFGLGSFILKKIPEEKDSREKVYSSVLSFWILTNVFLFGFIISLTFLFFDEYFKITLLTCLCFIFNSLASLNASNYQLFDSHLKFFIFSSGIKIIYAIQIIIFLLIGGINLEELLISFCSTSLLFFLYSLYDKTSYIKFIWTNPLNNDFRIFNFCFPLFINSLIAYLLFINSRFILDFNQLENYSATYSLAYSFSAFLTLIFNTFITLYAPKIFTIHKYVIKKIDSLVISLLMVTLFLSVLILIFYKIFVYYIMQSDDYLDTSIYLSIFLISQIIYIFYITKVDFLIQKNKTKTLLKINIFITLISLSINLLSIKFFGPLGVFCSIIIIQLLLATLVSMYVKEIKNSKSTVLYSILAIFFIFLISFLDSFLTYLISLIFIALLIYKNRSVLLKSYTFLNEKNTVY